MRILSSLGERFILFIDFGKLYNYGIRGAMVALLTLGEKGMCLIHVPLMFYSLCLCRALGEGFILFNKLW